MGWGTDWDQEKPLLFGGEGVLTTTTIFGGTKARLGENFGRTRDKGKGATKKS